MNLSTQIGFFKDGVTTFKINDIEYTMHNYVLKEMSIFYGIFDDKLNLHNIELKFPISQEIVESVLIFMYDSTKKILSENIKCIIDIIDIVCFMKYLGIDIKKIDKITKNMMKTKTIDNFIDECVNIVNSSELYYVFNFCKIIDKTSSIQYMDKFKLSNFPIEFSAYCIKKIIKCEFNECKFDITSIGGPRVSLDVITNIYEKFGFDIIHSIHFEKVTIPKPILSYKFEIILMTKFIVNDKEIKISNINKPHNSYYLINIFDTVVTHIVKLLFDITTL